MNHFIIFVSKFHLYSLYRMSFGQKDNLTLFYYFINIYLIVVIPKMYNIIFLLLFITEFYKECIKMVMGKYMELKDNYSFYHRKISHLLVKEVIIIILILFKYLPML